MEKIKNTIIFSQDEIQDIIQLFYNGQTVKQISIKYKVSESPIKRILHEQNIDIRKLSYQKQRKYMIDENFFNIIDTEEKAYILGFLFADGYNNKKLGSVVLTLQENDKDILDKMCFAMNYNKPLIYVDCSNKHDFGYTYKNQWKLRITNRTISDALEKLGMVQNKSNILKFPKDIPELLYSHFLRGYFDGDGCIYVDSIRNKILASFTSTEMFCNSVNSILQNKINISGKISESRNHNGITNDWRLFSKKQSLIFLSWLYDNATIYLQRKYDKYKNYLLTNNLLSA